MEKVEVKGEEVFSLQEKEEFRRILDKNVEKIKRMVNNDFYLRVSIKEYGKNLEKNRKRKRFSINAELSGEIPKIDASSIEWDLNKALHVVFNRLEEEIEHKFHISDK